MNLADFIAKLQLPDWCESETLEWKTSTKEMKEIVRSSVAFANTRGGHIVVGVRDDGSIVGQDISDASLREVAQTLLGNTEEKISFSLEVVKVEERQLLVISVPESPLAPHLAYGRPVKRIGTVVTAIAQQEYYHLLGKRSNGGGADRDLCPQATLDDINQDRLRQFLVLANERRSTNFNLLADAEQALTNLELINAGIVTKGAILLFGHNPQRFIPQAEFRVAHFSGSDRTQFLAQQIVTGDLFQQLEMVLQFIKERIPERINTLKEGSRIERVPPTAVFSELIANALIHRDYRDGASSYLNIIGQERVEIANPGLLLSPRLSAESMHLQHPSLPTNRRLARAFFLAGLIEQWGLGASRAAQLMIGCGLPRPVWQSERGTVSVTCELKSP